MEYPNDVAALIRSRVDSGAYASETEVMRQALDALSEVERAEEEIRTKLRISREELDRGEGIAAAEVFESLRRDHRERTSARDSSRA
jgi:Arc/MetJ-type ribon-helix-helix transcriptional regulator